MELVLIPILLLGGATLVYLGIHGERPNAWAAYGPHLSTPSGKRLSLPVSAELVAPVEAEIASARTVVAAREATVMTREVPMVTREPLLVTREPLPMLSHAWPGEERIEPVSAAPTFTQSDALIGELMTELAMMRDELNSIRLRMDVLSGPLQTT